VHSAAGRGRRAWAAEGQHSGHGGVSRARRDEQPDLAGRGQRGCRGPAALARAWDLAMGHPDAVSGALAESRAGRPGAQGCPGTQPCGWRGERTTAPYPYRRPRGAGLMKVLSTGIDTLNLAARGVVRSEVWELLTEAQQQARAEEESQPVE